MSSKQDTSEGWASRPVSRRTLTTGLIAGGIGLIAGGVGLFTYLRSRRPATPVQPQPPKSLVYTYRGHVHNLPKDITFIDSFAFLAWLPQSKRIVSILAVEYVTRDRVVSSGQVWDAIDGGHTSTFRFPALLYSTRALIIYPVNSPTLMSVNPAPPEGGPRVVWNDSGRGLFHVTDITTGKDLFTYTNQNKAEATFPFICSPDGRFVALANPQDNRVSTDEIRVRNLSTRQDMAPLVALSSKDGSRLRFRGWCWSPDSQRLVSWYDHHNADLYVWQVETGKVQTRYLKHWENNTDGFFLGTFRDVVWSPDSHLIASLVKGTTNVNGTATDTWSLHVWNADNGNQLCALKELEAESISIQWSPDSRMLAVIVRDRLDAGEADKWSVQIWNVDTGNQIFTIEVQKDEYVPSIQWSPDSQMLAVIVLGATTTAATGFSPKKTEVWRAASGTLLTTKPITSSVMAWTPDSKQIVSVRLRDERNRLLGEELELWEATTGRRIATYSNPTNRVAYGKFITWSPDGQYLAVGVELGTESGAVQVWKVR
jgi:WD40 repeat protein